MTAQLVETPVAPMKIEPTGNLIKQPFRLARQENKTVEFGRSYMAASAKFKVTAAEIPPSDIRFQFFDSFGIKVGEGVLQPGDRKTVEGELAFNKPVQIASVNVASYWNGATIHSLEIAYYKTETTRNLLSGQTIGAEGQSIRLETPLWVIGAVCGSRGLTGNPSDVHYYLDQSPGGAQVADLVMQPTNAAPATHLYTFNQVPVSAARLYAWWNAASADRLELIYLVP